MCGICFSCCLHCHIITELKNTYDESVESKPHVTVGVGTTPGIDSNKEALLNNRGPDVSLLHTIQLTETCQGTMQGCVLHLRGNLTPQPVTDETGNALLWNGEIFDGIPVKEDENDTQILFDILASSVTDDNILMTLTKIHGPWAFIYWQVYTEIPCVGVFCLDLNNSVPSLTLYPWNECRWPATTEKVIDTPQDNLWTYLYPSASTKLPVSVDIKGILKTWIPDINKEQPSASFIPDFDWKKYGDLKDVMRQIIEENKDLDRLADEFTEVLLNAVKKRVTNLPRKKQTPLEVVKLPANVAILFSGGLDSTILAALADRCMPPHETIDLLNVAFEQTKPMGKLKSRQVTKKHKDSGLKLQSTADDLTTTQSALSGAPSDFLDSCQYNIKYDPSLNNSICATSSDVSTNNSNPSFSQMAVAKRTVNSSSAKAYNNLSSVRITNGHRQKATYHIPNQSHENNSNELCVGESGIFDAFNVPDRKTARVALSELNPNRNWNFVEINISQAEVQSVRQSRIRRLIYPLHTVLDDSIGCAVWFAARGSGILPSAKGQEFTSKARVILCGMAADEQFAGYSRHRVTYNTKGYDGLVKEVQEEMWRISSRNLGRDDRIITDHGKESRFPFLDETFVHFCSTIPVFKRADLTLPRGVGEKLLLRLCAYKLGLQQTALQPKRAIQFGSKIAKLDNKKEKGSDICQRLK